MQKFLDTLLSQEVLIQLGMIVGAFIIAWLITAMAGSKALALKPASAGKGANKPRALMARLQRVIPICLGLVLLQIAVELAPLDLEPDWPIRVAVTLALLYVYLTIVREFVKNKLVLRAMLLVGIPLLLLQTLGVMPNINAVLESISIEIGNIKITLAGILRVLIFGSFVFWLGRVSSSTGQDVIRKQESIDFRTREVAAKIFEIGVFIAVSLLLLQIMGINLTALAVFGGALGVGLGFGLQAIASNFISGLIILLDRSLSTGDFVELEDGRTGYVTALNMRSTTLATFDGKDIMVPNEMFITSTFVNWTHKNKKQRYRVDFSVAYDSDIRKLVEIIKEAVATHPQVLSGEEYPIEERPDCEIDSFGDSGVNMFVEFWIEAIDDGKNRVGGDLLLIIFEAMRENGFTIPFPQREVRMLDDKEALQAT